MQVEPLADYQNLDKIDIETLSDDVKSITFKFRKPSIQVLPFSPLLALPDDTQPVTLRMSSSAAYDVTSLVDGNNIQTRYFPLIL